jgi:hypothetical protein
MNSSRVGESLWRPKAKRFGVESLAGMKKREKRKEKKRPDMKINNMNTDHRRK